MEVLTLVLALVVFVMEVLTLVQGPHQGPHSPVPLSNLTQRPRVHPSHVTAGCYEEQCTVGGSSRTHLQPPGVQVVK